MHRRKEKNINTRKANGEHVGIGRLQRARAVKKFRGVKGLAEIQFRLVVLVHGKWSIGNFCKKMVHGPKNVENHCRMSTIHPSKRPENASKSDSKPNA